MARKNLLYVGISLGAIAAVSLYVQQMEHPLSINAKDEKAVVAGKVLYGEYCASCHGRNLKGERRDWRTPKEDGTLPAPPHDETGHTWHHDDQLLFDYTKKGGQAMTPANFKSGMPAFGDVLSDVEIMQVLSYIKSRWPRVVQDRQEQLNKN